MEQRYYRSIIPLVLICFALLLAAVAVRAFLLKGDVVVTLKSAPALAGQVSQATATAVDGKAQLQGYGKDFTLQNVRYFDNDTWAFAMIKPTGPTGQGGVVVLKKEQGIYRAILGPGASFSSNFTKGIPADVVRYLTDQGYLYDTNQ